MSMRRAERVAAVVGAGRVVLGAAVLIAPAAAGGVLLGSRARRPTNRFLIRLIGVRDVVLGLGLLDAMRRDEATSRLAAMGAISNVSDTMLTAVHPGVPRGVRAAAMTASARSGGGGAWAAPRLRRK
jgi:hypothetical protein